MIKRNLTYTGAQGRKSLYDIFLPEKWNKQFVIFIHGYKGFKDWGCWNEMAKEFYDNGYGFCKFNTSHNGGTLNNPIDFPDLDAFAKNTYSFELEDTIHVIDLVKDEFNPNQMHIIGHSRGGGIACLVAAQNESIDTLCTLASVDDFANRFPKGNDLEEWRKKGFYSVKNGRTKQEMPHNYSFYTDFVKNREALDILGKLSKMKKASLHIHGEDDKAVDVQCSQKLSAVTNGKLCIIENTGHTFNTRHPWDESELPVNFQKVINNILSFYK